MSHLDDIQARLREAVADGETMPISLSSSVKRRLSRVRQLLEEGASGTIHGDRLLVEVGGKPPYEFALPEVATIGRDKTNDLPLSSPFVSRLHCRLIKRGDMRMLEDLGARNQVYVNGEPRIGCVLCDGDVIELGDVSLVFLNGQEIVLPPPVPHRFNAYPYDLAPYLQPGPNVVAMRIEQFGITPLVFMQSRNIKLGSPLHKFAAKCPARIIISSRISRNIN